MANEIEIIIKAVDKASSEIKKASGSLGGFESAAKAAAAALGGFTAGAAALTVVGKAVYDFGQKQMMATLAMDDLALKMGTTIDEASVLKEVTEDLRIEQTTLLTAMRGLTSNGLQPNIETMGRLADQYLKIQDPVKRAQFAAEQFGAKAGPEMRKLLELGSVGIRNQTQAVRDLGKVYTEEGVKSAQEFADAQDQLKDRWDALAIEQGPRVMNTLSDMVGFTDRVMQAFQRAGEDGPANIYKIYYQMYKLRQEAQDAERALAGNVAEAGFLANALGYLRGTLEDVTGPKWITWMEWRGQAAETGAQRLLGYLQEIANRKWAVNVDGTYVGPWQPGAGAGVPSGKGYGPKVEGPGGKFYRMNNTTGLYEPAQIGLDMVVPPGYNENFGVKASSGEHIKVTPAGKPNSGGGGVTINVNSTPMDVQWITKQLKAAVGM